MMERKVVMYIAVSLDGYIADSNGGVEWLDSYNNEIPISEFQTFYESIDTVLLGFDTYHQIVTELSPNKWPYEDKISYVFTSKKLDSTNNIKFINAPIEDYVKDLKTREGKNIWLCGGAAISNALIRSDLVDTFDLTIIPLILGRGIRLFDERNIRKNLRLVNFKKYKDIIRVIYEG